LIPASVSAFASPDVLLTAAPAAAAAKVESATPAMALPTVNCSCWLSVTVELNVARTEKSFVPLRGRRHLSLVWAQPPGGLASNDQSFSVLEARPEQAPAAICTRMSCHSRIIKSRPSDG
jgi:hypothetical protein